MARARAWAGAALKRAGERAGVEIRRHRPFGPRLARLLAERDIALVIDVGANRGQYAEELRRHGYRGRIESFEPLAAAHEELRRRSAGDDRWRVHRLALTDGGASLELGAADNFGSALPIGERLASLFPEAIPSAMEHVPAARLDEIDLDLPPSGGTLLKLDVQGYELRALAGAAGILPEVGMVEAELSVVPLYEDQPLLADLVRALGEAGFALATLEPILRDWRTGESLQFDGVFLRR